MRKSLLLISFFLIFSSLSLKKAQAVSCEINPPDGQIYANITYPTISCNGLDPDIKYDAFVTGLSWGKDDTPGQNNHCGKSDSEGNLSIVIITRPKEGSYKIEIFKEGLLCTKNGSVIAGPYNFSVKASNAILKEAVCDSGAGLNTALGCIPTKPDKFAVWFLKNAIGIGGGIAFLLIIWGAFNVITSGGNPEKLNNGKEIIVSAVTGLLMIIFSVVLLKIIGVDILAIPGFK